MKEKEEAIRGIAGYLKEHKGKAATRYFEEKIAGYPETVLKEHESEAINIIKLEEKFLKGKVKKELIKMIEGTPTLREEELRAKEQELDLLYNRHLCWWQEAEEGSEDKKAYQIWFEAARKKRDISRKEIEEETDKREKWVTMLKTGKLSQKKIKDVLSKKDKEIELEEIELRGIPVVEEPLKEVPLEKESAEEELEEKLKEEK